MRAIISYVLITARRDWLFLGLFLAVLVASFMSLFIGSTALSEQSAMQLAFLASSTRMILVIGSILFICFHIRRIFENREIQFILSHAISREKFILSYFISFVLLATILIIPFILFLTLYFQIEIWITYYYALSILLELILISSFAFLSSLILSSAVSAVLASFGFYIISRLMGFATAYIILPNQIQHYNATSFMELILTIFSVLLPRLDLFSKSKWLVYNDIALADIQLVLMQSCIYIPLLLFMTIIDFKKKEF